MYSLEKMVHIILELLINKMTNSNWGYRLPTKLSRKESQKVRSKRWRDKNLDRFRENNKRIKRRARKKSELLKKREEKLQKLLEIKKKIL